MDENTGNIVINILMPKKIEANDDWSCTLRISENGSVRNYDFYGIDSFQALNLALKMVPIEIKNLESKYGRSLKFLNGGDLYS